MKQPTSKRALIVGVTGQDGSYLAELLVAKGYQVWGTMRRASSGNIQRITHLVEPLQGGTAEEPRLQLLHADLTDVGSLIAALEISRPDEVYCLAAQSHVQVSFEMPEFTANVTGLGPLRLLQAMRDTRSTARFFHAGSSEQFGKVVEVPQTEATPFHPRSPYACAKVFAFQATRNYRESYGMFAANGLLFNHESPRRGETFVTRKISRAVAAIVHGHSECLLLGNLDARRDWGFAGDYVEAMWRILQAPQPDDFVIATGETHSVADFCNEAFAHAGLPLAWEGKGRDRRGIGPDGRCLVRIDPRYFRPAEVDQLLGDAGKAHRLLGWRPRTHFHQLVRMMVDADLNEPAAERASGLATSGE